MHKTLALFLAGAIGVGVGGSALAGDLVMTRGEATELTQSNVGKPFWALQAQCAGIFGASYAYQRDHGDQKGADADKDIGVAMLDAALARLEADRGIDRNAAMALAEPEVDRGRSVVAPLLTHSGNGPETNWNFFRSACLDIDAAARAHLGS
jgi:hypothetical protein